MKRKRPGNTTNERTKRQKLVQESPADPPYPLLKKFYPKSVTLRQYLVDKLLRVSKNRQKRIQTYGRHDSVGSDPEVTRLLDAVIVGTFQDVPEGHKRVIPKDIIVFTQQFNASALNRSLTPGRFKQTEIIDFVIWLLFRRCSLGQRPQHLLCQGFQRSTISAHGEENALDPGIPGIFPVASNDHVATLKSHPWNALPDLLGGSSEQVLGDLFLQCGIFVPIGSDSNLLQLSGTPMSDLRLVQTQAGLKSIEPSDAEHGKSTRNVQGYTGQGLAEIRFVRHRMLYARPELDSKGAVWFGLPRTHVLNRLQNCNAGTEGRHLIKYMFPAQHGLHNVLKCTTNRKETAYPYKDYSVREEEISRLQKRHARENSSGPGHLPRRLRGSCYYLALRLWKRHLKCSYSAMLDHYCPRTRQHADGPLQHAIPVTQVSAFCRAITWKVFPRRFWGSDAVMQYNCRRVHQSIDRFVRFRRFESMSLHDLMQGIKIVGIEWLEVPKTTGKANLSYTDLMKRKELMSELLYYLFDSFVIPLIRGHFHVTETTMNRNQIVYFRHDVWKELSEPALNSLRSTMLEECKGMSVKRMLAGRSLGVSTVRMLPKENGMRPIINLRRRMQRLRNGHAILGKSINGVLTPLFSVLNCEKASDPRRLGSAMFSVNDIFPRLQAFKTSLEQKCLGEKPLYFAKVDVQACFDTIPQKRLLEVAREIIAADEYQISRFSRAKLIGRHDRETPGFGSNPSWRFLTKAHPSRVALRPRQEIQSDIEQGHRRAVYIDDIVQKREFRRDLVALLEEHVGSNLLKIGRRLYRQKEGIPQGSIVSSLLCSYFYAELERKVLGFLDNDHSVVLRLIDDFLVITTDRSSAERFMRTMHDGVPEFGITIKADKSRTNFDVEIQGERVTRLPEAVNFPYCGNTINTVTLDLGKDTQRRRKNDVADSLTVEFSKIPGQAFYRKTLSALKLRLNTMHLSTTYNSLNAVLVNLYCSFLEVALKNFHYIRTLPRRQQPSPGLSISKCNPLQREHHQAAPPTSGGAAGAESGEFLPLFRWRRNTGAVDDLIKLAQILMRQRKRNNREVVPYECAACSAGLRRLCQETCPTSYSDKHCQGVDVSWRSACFKRANPLRFGDTLSADAGRPSELDGTNTKRSSLTMMQARMYRLQRGLPPPADQTCGPASLAAAALGNTWVTGAAEITGADYQGSWVEHSRMSVDRDGGWNKSDMAAANSPGWHLVCPGPRS